MTVKAWVRVLAGFAMIAIVYGALQPLFDVLYELNATMGGQAAAISGMIYYILRYIFPVLCALSLLLYGVLSSTTEEDNSRYR